MVERMCDGRQESFWVVVVVVVDDDGGGLGNGLGDEGCSSGCYAGRLGTRRCASWRGSHAGVAPETESRTTHEPRRRTWQ